MKVKFISHIITGIGIAVTLVSCSSSSQMASSFSSRKYTKGYFFNSAGSANTTAAKTTETPKVAAQVTGAQAVNTAPVVAVNTLGTANAKEQNKQVMPAQHEYRKMTFKEAVALAKHKATVAASASQPITAIAATESTTKMESTANVQWHHEGGGGHLVLTIILFVLMIVLIVVLISAAENAG